MTTLKVGRTRPAKPGSICTIDGAVRSPVYWKIAALDIPWSCRFALVVEATIARRRSAGSATSVASDARIAATALPPPSSPCARRERRGAATPSRRSWRRSPPTWPIRPSACARSSPPPRARSGSSRGCRGRRSSSTPGSSPRRRWCRCCPASPGACVPPSTWSSRTCPGRKSRSTSAARAWRRRIRCPSRCTVRRSTSRARATPAASASVSPAAATTCLISSDSPCTVKRPWASWSERSRRIPAGVVRMAQLVVDTVHGRVRGEMRGGAAAWKGIPYAAPPVRGLRFRPPRPPTPWTGERNATHFAPVAPQSRDPVGAMLSGVPAKVAMDEDCLALNVFSPAGAGSKRPVVVFLHGGAFIMGSGSTPLYDGASFAARHDLVVVTINYRLGLLGLLYLGDLCGAEYAEGNCALLDQIAALGWVQGNIASFGGDPDSVTVMGQSAGAISLGTL